MSDIVIVGGGAAGMMAAVWAADGNNKVSIYEKNDKLGKKIYITGKGRCNLTNACEPQEFSAGIHSNPKFLFSAFSAFDNRAVMSFFENAGLKLKIERGQRVFPESDKASDVTAALKRLLDRKRVDIHLNSPCRRLLANGDTVEGIELEDGTRVRADRVIVCTGGLSYPTTGSTGDGHRFAEVTGHRLVPTHPALVPMETKGDAAGRLQGLSLRNVSVRIRNSGGKVIFSEFGEMLFTHFGVSGPLLLSASSVIGKALDEGSCHMGIDLKPALSEEELDSRLIRDFSKNLNRRFSNSLGELLPSKLIPVFVEMSGIDPEKRVHDISREERAALRRLFKDFPMEITSLRGYSEAIVTSGGVSVKDISPKTMESRKIKGLYFAGEVLDLDGMTGGFNLQIAWSTGAAAGRACKSTDTD